MHYEKIVEGIFIARPNRFIAHVEIGGEMVVCHVKNTGRCKELLIPGVRVYLQEADNPNRKTKYDLIGVVKSGVLINMDSQAPNRIVEEWIKKGHLFSKEAKVRREVTYGQSRFDLYVEDGEKKAFIEVKGVTLEEGGVARFPDAPTQRGVKHIMELVKARQDGYLAYLIFAIQMKGIRYMEPNDLTHPEFGQALREAGRQGVEILAYDSIVRKDTLELDHPIEVHL